MLECSIIVCILGFIIFFIIGIKCTFPARHQKRKSPARHQKRKSPARRPGGFEIRRKKGSTY
jgi:NADH:ubiquinone oxidoreductase subunit H